MNITLATQATERDASIARNLVNQIGRMTLAGNGFTGYTAIPNGAELDFRLSRPFGHRSIYITLNAMDTYDMKVVRYGKNFREYTVVEYSGVFFDQLNDLIWEGIAKSCNM